MEFERTDVEGCRIVRLEPRGDERGFFARAFSVEEFEAEGLVSVIDQVNLSRSERPGTTRGLHWQEAPHAEAKFVRCIRGRAFDVCVDVRPGSPSFRRWVGVELSAENRVALYVPPGCAHGYQTLEPGTELLYSASAAYAPQAERGAAHDDPAFGVAWPLRDDLTLSEKDRSWPPFAP